MGRILIIDDEVQIRAMLRQVLECSGYHVSDAPDGKVGMKLHRKETGRPDHHRHHHAEDGRWRSL